MKKILFVLLSVVSLICMAFAVGGCGNKERGKLYTLKQAYDSGWIQADDLKSIACRYYDGLPYTDNPYQGLYDPHEELSEENEKEIKQAYLNKYDNIYQGEFSVNDIETRYYGTYNGNIVAGFSCERVNFDVIIEDALDIGGVIFYNFWQGSILVYHIG